MDDRSSGALKAYRDKRNFDITPEPAGGGVANEHERVFVIQKHWATRLHYDLRLELDGTMKSWAVPKGPSFDSADKRMAVHVEDHLEGWISASGWTRWRPKSPRSPRTLICRAMRTGSSPSSWPRLRSVNGRGPPASGIQCFAVCARIRSKPPSSASSPSTTPRPTSRQRPPKRRCLRSPRRPLPQPKHQSCPPRCASAIRTG